MMIENASIDQIDRQQNRSTIPPPHPHDPNKQQLKRQLCGINAVFYYSTMFFQVWFRI
jgi:hypothetical protein